MNFRSRHYLKECLFSISENLPAGIETEVLVINNDELPLEEIGSQVCSRSNLDLPISVLEINRNIGFGGAHNIGFEKSRGEYILFLNPDTKIPPGSLEKILEAFAEDEKVGIVGPLLVDSAGNVQPDCFGAHRTPLSTIKKKIFKRKDCQVNAGKEIFETDWISGGAMLVRRDVFEKTGGFDKNLFMYFEDVDLCLRAKKQGLKIVVNPKARIFHESGKSFASEWEKKKYYYASQNYYIRKHFGRTAAGFVKLLRFPYYVRNIYFK